MEKLHHQLWVTEAVNAVFGPIAAAMLRAFGRPVPPGDVIPDYLAMLILLTLALTIFALIVRSRLSVEHPGRLQIIAEDYVNLFHSLLDDFVGPKGRRYLPLIGSMFLLIWISNLAGLVPGLMAPTSNLNVTLGCAITVWVFYHVQGIREQGVVAYLKHFAVPPGSPVIMAPLMLIIETISHFARVMSLTLRLFGNIFGEELVILILFSLVPFFVPLPMMFLGLITASLQAFIFVLLTTIYLGGAVATEHEQHEHGEMAAGAV
jgi:F-type H+-transporting ATPase subunit a